MTAAVVAKGHRSATLRLALEDLDGAIVRLHRSQRRDLAGVPAWAVIRGGASANQSQSIGHRSLGVAKRHAAAGPRIQPANLASDLVGRAGELQPGQVARELGRECRQGVILRYLDGLSRGKVIEYAKHQWHSIGRKP